MARAFILGALLVATAFMPAAAQTQPGPQIFQSWLGKTLALEFPDGQKSQVVYASDGTAKVSGAYSDTGKWRLTDDGYCLTWAKLRGGREICLTITPWDGRFLLVQQGTTIVTGTITPR